MKTPLLNLIKSLKRTSFIKDVIVRFKLFFFHSSVRNRLRRFHIRHYIRSSHFYIFKLPFLLFREYRKITMIHTKDVYKFFLKNIFRISLYESFIIFLDLT